MYACLPRTPSRTVQIECSRDTHDHKERRGAIMHAGFFNAQAVLKPYILKAISRGRFISTLGRGGESETDVFFRDEFGVKSRGTVLY